jgi:creatinine amidohydrolase
MREWVLAEENHAFVRSKQWEVVVLPVGATEPHNLHLPYATDTLEVQMIAERACEVAYKKGAAVMCLPTLPFGVNTNHFKIPGGMVCSLYPETLYRVIADIVDSMERQGIRKMLILNGHGGNEIKPALRTLQPKTKVFLCMADFWRMSEGRDKEIFSDLGDHGGEMETSLGLAFFSDLVKLEQADAGELQQTRFDAINKGWVSITRPWHLATTNAGIGNPFKATAGKGRAYMDLITAKLGGFLAELAAAPMNEKFPY